MDGTLDKTERDRRLTGVDTDLAALDERRELVNNPARIDWTWDAKEINTILRTYWTTVQLDERMQSVRTEWRLPGEWIA